MKVKENNENWGKQWKFRKRVKIEENNGNRGKQWKLKKTMKIEENNENWGKQYDSWGNTMKNEEEH